MRDGTFVNTVSNESVSHEKDSTADGSVVNFSSTQETVSTLVNKAITKKEAVFIFINKLIGSQTVYKSQIIRQI